MQQSYLLGTPEGGRYGRVRACFNRSLCCSPFARGRMRKLTPRTAGEIMLDFAPRSSFSLCTIATERRSDPGDTRVFGPASRWHRLPWFRPMMYICTAMRQQSLCGHLVHSQTPTHTLCFHHSNQPSSWVLTVACLLCRVCFTRSMRADHPWQRHSSGPCALW